MKLDRTVAEVAALVGGTVAGGSVAGAPDRRLAALESVERAGPDDLVAVFRPGVLWPALVSRAGALLVGEAMLGPEPAASGKILIRVASAEDALDRLISACAPKEAGPPPGVHASAVVEPGAEIGPGAAVGAHVVVSAGARVGARAVLWPGVFIGERAQIGADCRLHPHVVVGSRCRLGDRVLVHAGTVIGADGFGFRQDGEGRHIKIPQVGTVEIGDDVEIGANCTIDRARFDATRVGRGCKLDDQVHVGHNVRLGEHCALAAHVALGGSVVAGDKVLIGGRSAVASGVTLGAGTRIGGGSVVIADTAPGARVTGFPAQAHGLWARGEIVLRRLARGRLPRGRSRDRSADRSAEQPPR